MINTNNGIFFVPKNDSNEINYMYTDCNYGGVRILFPCVDNLNDKATYELEITTNQEYVVVASGNLIGKVKTKFENEKILKISENF